MYQTLTTSQAADLLLKDDNANWSYAGAKALIEYFEEMEDQDEPIEFNHIEIRCEWSEYESAREAAEQLVSDPWADDLDPDADEEEIEAAALEVLNERTTVIPFRGGVIVRDF